MLLRDNCDVDRWVNVIDCPMGAGKTTAAISYIDSSPSYEKVVFATPYVSECERVANSCKSKKVFAIEEDEKDNTKTTSLRKHLLKGQNVSCTHQLLLWFDKDIQDTISSQNYTLVIDEAADVVQAVNTGDVRQLNWLINHNCVEVDKDTGVIKYVSDFERDSCTASLGHVKIVGLINRGRVSMIDGQVFIWEFPIELLNCFKRIFVLTYQFDYQLMNYYMLYNGYSINHLGVRMVGDLQFEFCDKALADGFRYDVKSLIHILDKEKLNRVGDDRCALSHNWYKKSVINGDGNVERIAKNIRNVQKNVFKCKTGDFIWTVFNDFKEQVADKNISGRYVDCCRRAENKWGNCHYLAYGIGRYQNPDCANFFKAKGFPVDNDMWALASMIQWIWRSAIRNGEEIYIYIPSRKMRTLLIDWIDSVSRGGGNSE